MRLSQSLQSSLPAQVLSALTNAVRLNSLRMFMIVTLPSCMESSQRIIKQCPVLTLGHFQCYGILANLDWRLYFFLTMNPFPSAFQGPCSSFSIFLIILQNHRLMKIRSAYANVEFRVSADIKDGVLCHGS